jgi:hypothetical protein
MKKGLKIVEWYVSRKELRMLWTEEVFNNCSLQIDTDAMSPYYMISFYNVRMNLFYLRKICENFWVVF